MSLVEGSNPFMIGSTNVSLWHPAIVACLWSKGRSDTPTQAKKATTLSHLLGDDMLADESQKRQTR
jgi:hypothetical protein